MIARTEDDYLKLLQALQPKGKIWTLDPDADWTKLLKGLAVEFSRIDQRALDLINESLPSQIDELLEEWENEYGIYSEDIELKTKQERINTVVTKYLETGGTYEGYFEEIGSNLGYTLSIQLDSPFWVGYSTVGAPVGGLLKQFWWRVLITIEEDINYNLERLMYEIQTFKSGHTQVDFEFYGRGFSRGFNCGFNSFPDFDNSWGDNRYGKIGDSGLGFSRGFDNSFANAYDYNGIMLVGGFSHGFSIGTNRHSGGSFSGSGFSNGFYKPH